MVETVSFELLGRCGKGVTNVTKSCYWLTSVLFIVQFASHNKENRAAQLINKWTGLDDKSYRQTFLKQRIADVKRVQNDEASITTLYAKVNKKSRYTLIKQCGSPFKFN